MLLPGFVAAAIMASAAAQHPAITPDASVMRLDEVGLYRVGYRYRGQPEQELAYGWSGHFHEPTGVSCLPFGRHSGREAFLLHCPWRGGTGTAFQEFRFALPRVRSVSLKGATAMKSDAVRESDGVVFRIFVNGGKRWERVCHSAEWEPFSIDLSRYAGQTIRVRFETDPGPADNPGFDFSLWGDRTLTMDGYTPPVVRQPAPPPLPTARMVGRGLRDVTPTSGFAGRRSVRQSGSAIRLRYEGPDGALEYAWNPSAADLGSLVLTARRPGGRPTAVHLAGNARLEWTTPANIAASAPTLLPDGSGAVCLKRVTLAGSVATLRLEARLVGKSLVLSAGCDQPIAASLDAGDWGPTLRRRPVAVPYYGQVSYLPHEGLFVNRFLDWTTSSASSHADGKAHYAPLTDGSRALLRERAIYTAAWHLAETLPNIANPPSPYLDEVGSSIVLDVWGGRYADIAAKLEILHGFGIRRCIVLIHDWQRSGYDNALPMHIPAAADKGGDDGMKALVATARRLGYRIALHENYVDYYPNYDHYDERHIALDSAGVKVKAWYNPGTEIQSFAVQPNAILPLAESQSPEIHRRFHTNSCYLDVHSAVPPWFHVDFRAGEAGAGTFRRVFEAHRELWDFERRIHGGPVFGEGNTHWYWSGLLDGVEAQFGVGWPANMGQSAPLMVDFNLLKVHPLQINHGQGYYERWWQDLPWGAVPPMALLDQYRLQEIVFGHAGFLGASTWDKVPYAWLEHHLVVPVTSRHAGVDVKSIEYLVNGKWLDTTAAAIAQDWRRPRIVYANGLTIIGNASSNTWRVRGEELPQHGWLAYGAGVTASTALRDGSVSDYVETDRTVFANARPARDWDISGLTNVRPKVVDFVQMGPRQFRVLYRWDVTDQPRSDYQCFVHFSRPSHDLFDESIRFQQDHGLPGSTSAWPSGGTIDDGPHEVTVPDDLPDGDYEWTIGLFTPQAGRAIIEGPTDRSGRVLLGTLRVSDGGASLSFQPNTVTYASRAAMFRDHLNDRNRVVAFPSVRTDGSVLIERDGSEWVLRTWPRRRPFTVEISASRFPAPAEVRCVDADPRHVTPEPAGKWWRLPMVGAAEYRWAAR